MDHGILNDLAICIVAAWVLGVIAQLLKQPLLIAYMVAGFMVGPEAAGLKSIYPDVVGVIHDEGSIETISELGLILLLFLIGLEIDLKKILSAGKLITLTASIQVVGGALLGILTFWMAGFPMGDGKLDAVYLGVAAALSSTVIIVKILYDKRELDTLAGRITLGILVLQDLFAILFLALQPSLQNPAITTLVMSLVKVVVLVAIAFTASRYMLPPVFRAVARLPELVLVGALAWCFLIAGLASALGLSREMGALVAGVAISTFPYTLDVVAKATAIRDFFVTLFFVALGMKIPAPTYQFITWSLVLSLFVIVSRFVTVFFPLHRQKQGHRASVLPGFYLAQISEFSLVILTLGAALGHISDTTMGIVSYAFVILAVVSSYAMMQAEGLLRWVSRWLSDLGQPDLDEQTVMFEKPRHQPKIFLLGFSWTASSVLEEIKRHDPNLLPEVSVIDFNPQVNEELRARGIHVTYGDVSQRATLEHAGIEHAEIIVSSLPNTMLKGTTNLKLVQLVRQLNPEAQIIAHAESFPDVPLLYAAGANYVAVTRLVEAADFLRVITAARNRLLDERRVEQDRDLKNRYEVIP